MNNKSDSKNTNPTIKQQAITSANEVKEKATVQKNVQPVQISPIDSEQFETKLDKPLFFSDDPFINHSIISGLYQPCVDLFRSEKNKELHERYKYYSQITKKRVKEHYKYCQKVNDEHPEFNLNDSEQLYKNRTGENSLIERAFNYKVAFGEDDSIDSQFIKDLSQTDPRVLLSQTSFYAMSSFHMSNSTAIVMKLIDSQHIGHVFTLLDKAQHVYNCNQNGGCDKNSALMYYICMNHEESCNLENYNEFLKFTMTKGQQADLAIVVSYIETLFENQ
jgi:hypothetical protein